MASVLRRLWSVVPVLVIFLIVGPPVGAVTFFLVIAAFGLAGQCEPEGFGWIGLFAVIYGAPLSYVFGSLPALAAGTIIAIRRTYGTSVSLAFAALTGVGVGAGMQTLTSQPLLLPNGAALRIPVATAAVIGACLGATLVCNGIVRLLLCQTTRNL
jgi:hypothetical protein